MSTSYHEVIPVEIVQQIFSLFSPKQFDILHASDLPWFLGHICSAWRSIFLSMTTEFWSTFSLPTWKIKSTDDIGRARMESVVRFFLERGHDRKAPLSFSVELASYLDNNAILEMLINESMRWRKVQINSFAESELLPFTRVANRLPLLQELYLHCFTQSGASRPLHSIFQTAPSLNVLDIESSGLGHWKFDWSNLKAVRLSSACTSNFIAPLSQMTNLTRLLIFDEFKSGPIGRSIIVLPSLASLGCHSNWLPFLKAPALEELIINHSNTDHVLPFLRRSSCNISHLCLLSSNAASAIDVIRHTPQISRLDLSRIIKINKVLDQLLILTDPARKLLACCMSSLGVDLASERILDLILSRTGALDCASCKKLQRLDIFRQPCEVLSRKLAGLCKERGVQYTNSSAKRGISHRDAFRL